MSENKNTILTVLKNDDFQTAYVKDIADTKEKIEMYNALTSPVKKMSECIGDVLKVKNIAITPVEIEDRETGEIKILPKTIILTHDGDSYVAVSIGVYNSITGMYNIFKEEFEKGEMTVKIRQKNTRSGKQTLILEIVQ